MTDGDFAVIGAAFLVLFVAFWSLVYAVAAGIALSIPAGVFALVLVAYKEIRNRRRGTKDISTDHLDQLDTDGDGSLD